MTPFDIIRFAVFAESGAALAFMIGTNYLAFRVLRPPRRLGFLWWHVTCQSLATMMIGLIAIERVAGRLGDPPTWRTWWMFVALTLLLAAQMIIYQVERQRFIARLVVDRHGEEQLAHAVAALDER